MRQRWLLVLLPLVLGLGLAALLAGGALPNPVFYLRADLAALAMLLGTLASLLVALVLAVRAREARLRRAIEQTQTQAADDRRRFLRRLDHELKNPLTAIRAGLVNLAGAPDEAARREAIGSVEAQALRLSRLAEDLRKLAELETHPLEQAPVDLLELLQEVTAVAQERPESADRRLALTLPQAPWPLPPIPGDRDLLFLAVHNLLDNALKFSRPGDTVEVRAFEDGASVNIEVADTGPGISEEELAHVWEELYRGQAARGTPGSGLGLALTRAIIERHGGQVALRSRVGQGTVVTLKLPVAPHSGAGASLRSP